MGMLGGIKGPQHAALAMITAVKSALYPSFFMAGMRTDPIAVASATADPDRPAKNILATTLTSPRAPLNRPTRRFEKWISLWVIPPPLIIAPARIKKGIQRSGSFSIPAMTLWTIIIVGTFIDTNMPRDVKYREKAMGKPIIRVITKMAIITSEDILLLHEIYYFSELLSILNMSSIA
jgi:hypothetical protein